jgi:predicted Zn finger-like uncharacterized protein
MYSQCPDCLARFHITAVQLRAAHGTVRCGRCGAAFDALARLSDSLPRTQPAESSNLLAAVDEIAAAAESGVPPEYHFSAADLEKVFIEARDWSPPRATTLDADGEPEELIVDEPEQVEDITLEGERIAIEDIDTDSLPAGLLGDVGNAEIPLDFDLTGDVKILDEDDATHRPPALRGGEVDEPTVASVETSTNVATRAPEPPTRREAPARDWPLPAASRTGSAVAGTASPAARWSQPAAPEEDVIGDDEDHESQLQSARLWTIGSAVLAVLLLVQLVHSSRDRLARQPGIGGIVRSVYGALGVPLGNAWNLDAFELRQWGTGSDLGAGRLNVRASLTNRADFPQPLPLLRVEIEDRFGAAVAIRDFRPSEYLKDPGRVGRLLATGESADAQLDVIATGLDGVGYRLNVCMSEADGTVRCASAPG